MTDIIYSSNYKRNLTLFWRQFYPNWKIPDGFQVHHIKPRCTFLNKKDPKINHPSNLIALHPDDHVTIHKHRGDKQLSGGFITSIVGRRWTEEQKQARCGYKHTLSARNKISKANKGKPKSQAHRDKISKSRSGMKLGPPSKEHRQKLSMANKGKTRTLEQRKKMSAGLKGKHVWNKGLTGRRWYNNGIISKICYPNKAPYGFRLGRK